MLHFQVRISTVRVREPLEATPAYVCPARKTFDMIATVDSDDQRPTSSARLAVIFCEVALHGLFLRIATGLACCACLSKVVFGLTAGAVDCEARRADLFAGFLVRGQLLAAIWPSAYDKGLRAPLTVGQDHAFEEGAICCRREMLFQPVYGYELAAV